MTQVVLLFASVVGSGVSQPCVGAATAPSLDHVILVVHDLEQASAGFRNEGFRLKAGRLHPNGLRNRHVKFRDGSGIELMTVQGEPADAMAEDYAALLRAGEGGVYVALEVPDLTTADVAANKLRLKMRRSSSGPWRFLSFPPGSQAAAVFFSSGGIKVNDPDSLVSHRPGLVGLAEAWLEGGRELGLLLQRLGAKKCGTARSPTGAIGERWGLSHGTLVIVPPRPATRHRVLGVALRRTAVAGTRNAIVYPHRDFWLHYRADPSGSGDQ